MDPRLKLIVKGNPNEELHLLLRLNNPNKFPKNCQVISHFGDIISCRIFRKDLLNVYDDPATRSLKAPQVIPVNRFDELNEEMQYKSKRYSSPISNKKSNVVFGIIDFGFDFTHRDFQDKKGDTRFEKIWVQSSKENDTNKYGYGKVLHASKINQALNSDQPFKHSKYHPGKNDFLGRGMHGTHVLGIAAASGAVGPKGFACSSPIVAVDMGFNHVNGSNLSLGDSVKLIEGIDFILQQAGNRPCVINMSLGGHCSDHTGNTLAELAINNIVKLRGGTAIVQSTGNYFQSKCHSSGKLKTNDSKLIEWQFKSHDNSSNEIEIWYEGEDKIRLDIYDSEKNLLTRSNPFQDVIFNYDTKYSGIIFHRKEEPNSKKNHINIIIAKRPKSKVLWLELFGEKIENGEYHAYIERDDVGQSFFANEDVDQHFTLGSICNAPLAITVGAYDQYNSLSLPMSFSSAGPTVDRRVKPELLAPGNKIKAARSASKFNKRAQDNVTAKSGSSMAAPYISSLLVKAYEKFPQMNIYELRDLLFKSCNSIKSNNSYLTNKAGYGIIDAKAFKKLVIKKRQNYENNI